MWQPSASLPVLKQRARLLAAIRAFFAGEGVFEVDVPVLGEYTVTDPHLEAVPARVGGETRYLQTSPEYYMKRLLAAGAGSLFYLGKAFRQDERGRRHRPEFTLLEWYCLGFDDAQLQRQVLALLQACGVEAPVQRTSYGELFQRAVGGNPHTAHVDALAALARERLDIHWADADKSTWLDVLFSHCIEPMLDGITVVYDYPACQCALARLATDANNDTVAKRFEIFYNGMELANGYWELTDAAEQAARFDADNRHREALGLPHIEPDRRLLAALNAGLPDCAGVALGVDRLLMCLTGADRIDDVLAF